MKQTPHRTYLTTLNTRLNTRLSPDELDRIFASINKRLKHPRDFRRCARAALTYYTQIKETLRRILK